MEDESDNLVFTIIRALKLLILLYKSFILQNLVEILEAVEVLFVLIREQ